MTDQSRFHISSAIAERQVDLHFFKDIIFKGFQVWLGSESEAKSTDCELHASHRCFFRLENLFVFGPFFMDLQFL